MILRYTVTPLGRWTSLYLEDLGDNEYTRGGSRVRTINNPFEFTESWQVVRCDIFFIVNNFELLFIFLIYQLNSIFVLACCFFWTAEVIICWLVRFLPRFRRKKKSNTKLKNKRTQSNKQKRQPSYVFFAVLLGSLLMILSLLIYCAFCFFSQPGGLDIRWEECNNRIFSHQVFVLTLKIYIYIYYST